MKVYDDVFVASEAVDWLHGYLKTNPNFGPSVNRQQAIQLCQKFLSHKIIEDARGKRYNSAVFEDNSHLYRFINIRYSPYKRIKTPRQNSAKPPLAKQDSIDSTGSSFGRTPSKVLRRSSRFNFSRRSLSNAPPRTPLGPINSQVMYMGSTESDSKALKSEGMKGKSNRRENDSDVIMNPAALGPGCNRHSLTNKEVTEIWWNIAITRYSRYSLMFFFWGEGNNFSFFIFPITIHSIAQDFACNHFCQCARLLASMIACQQNDFSFILT